ncbi:TIGR04283 family arsenosugar biosynthesis glycosyltransferase [Gaetbulibacter sp. M235]|uniref:TIGR04283 family arsenosugar biosynthesis glycosyltransferase n=1 Tax=Gaetbulibacter sp. M235 TaxID=3126510 RepID=UPI00374F417A
MNKISIIIPVLNEAETLAKLLNHLIESSSKENIAELIVVDGGSTDKTTAIASKFEPVFLITSGKGRAKQMNLGAKHTTGSILYFLHADSFPPKNFDKLIINEVEKGNLSGCFKMRFDSNHWWMRLAGWLTRFNWIACRGGDQSLFITTSLFNSLGGYDEQYIIYEDNVFIKKLYAIRQFKVIQKDLITSARLYKRLGVWRLQYHFFRIHLKHWLGANAYELHSYYKKHIT